MFPKRVALPRPRQPEGIALVADADLTPQQKLDQLTRKRNELSRDLGALDAEVERIAFESICGSVDDSQHVEKYDGMLGVTRAFVDTYEPPVGQLQWLDDLAERFNGQGDSPGDVSGVRWGSGCMIGDELFITAGHCFDQDGGGWSRPERNGQTIPPEEVATLMRVNFKYQINGATNQLRVAESFPVVELVEYRLGGLDFAIARLGANGQGILPGTKYGRFVVALHDLIEAEPMLCIIQHPNGSPKKVEAGPMRDNEGGRITYDSLDTLGGSSGAPILSVAGELVGVHTNGGCSAFSGYNYGVAIDAIREVSSHLAGSVDEYRQHRDRGVYSIIGGPMKSFTGQEFVKALTSEGGLSVPSDCLTLTGMVKSSSGGAVDSVLFSPGTSCAFWIPVPVKMIDRVDHLGKIPCRDHEHDFVRLRFKMPTTDEGRVLTELLQQEEPPPAETEIELGTQEWPSWPSRPSRWRPPWTWSRCAKCKLEVNLFLTGTVMVAAAAAGTTGPGALAVWKALVVSEYGVAAFEAIKAYIVSEGVGGLSERICQAIGKC